MSPQTSVRMSTRALLGVITAAMILTIVVAVVVTRTFDHSSKQADSGPVATPSTSAPASVPTGSTEDPARHLLADNVTLKVDGGSDCNWGFAFFHGVPEWKGMGDGTNPGTAVEINAFRCFGRSVLRGNFAPVMAVVSDDPSYRACKQTTNTGDAAYDACSQAASSNDAEGSIQFSDIPVGTVIAGKDGGSLVWRLQLVSAPSSSNDPGVWKLTAWGLPVAAQ